jgi:hypothetical protein
VLVGALVWHDNQVGFRDAGAFADLLAAVFGMISVVWLVGAVLLQREELMLQREELTLQRGEVQRLADETTRQATLMDEQLAIQRKATLVEEFRSFLLSESARLVELRDEIATLVDNAARRQLGIDEGPIRWRYYGRKHIRVMVVRTPDADEEETHVRYAEIARDVAANPRIRRGHQLWRRCQRLNLGFWFRRHLPYLAGPVPDLTVYQIIAFANVAARARPSMRD